jgi:hypothetical protein
MARDWLNAEIARQRQDEIRRDAERIANGADGLTARRLSARVRPQEAVTIRLAAVRVVARLSRALLPR